MKATIVPTMFNFQSGRFKRSLDETIAWCATLSLKLQRSGSTATMHRRALIEESGQLLQQAHERANRRRFRREVSETKEWQRALTLLQEVRDSLGPLEHQLRSAALRPTSTLNELNTPWTDVVAEVIAKRSHLVGRTSLQKDVGTRAGGRLLLYFPSENLADGAAQVSSCGFFDVDNVPPWDIWVDFSERTLVSWVPPVLLEAAQMGIDVNPEACIQWAD